ncbi:MAG: caspase family protein, partial [Verrucomicrobiales bacterium]|nr:caspase family protein [Verrucomicrobiales bacterium]
MKSLIPLLFAFIAMCLPHAAAADRVALIIGVDDYQSDTIPNLDGALRDARLMAQTLEKMHTPFEVILLEDPSLNETLDSL